MEKKVIFLDVDGTLTNYSNVVPESAKIAIKKARENGHLVYMVTGRSKAENPEEIVNIGFDGIIGGNGNYIESHDQVIYHKAITLSQCTHIVDWLHLRGLEFYLEGNDGLFVSENFLEASKDVLKLYRLGKGATQEEVDNMDVKSFMHGIVEGANLYRDDINKVSYILKDYQNYLDSIEEFPDLKAGTWGGKGNLALFGDLGVKGFSKESSIQILLQHLGMELKDTYAFGDATIDIPMIQLCAVGVAVGSGSDDLKAAADYVTKDVDDDGIYFAFNHFGLID